MSSKREFYKFSRALQLSPDSWCFDLVFEFLVLVIISYPFFQNIFFPGLAGSMVNMLEVPHWVPKSFHGLEINTIFSHTHIYLLGPEEALRPLKLYLTSRAHNLPLCPGGVCGLLAVCINSATTVKVSKDENELVWKKFWAGRKLWQVKGLKVIPKFVRTSSGMVLAPSFWSSCLSGQFSANT